MSNIIIDDDNKDSEVNINDEVQKDFLNNIIQDDNIVDIILRQIENDNELSNIDYLEDLLERVDDYREKYKDDLDLINISRVKEQEIYIQILSKLLVEKYKFPEDVLEQYDIPSTLKNLLTYSYKTLVLKRKELIVNFLENIIINDIDVLYGSGIEYEEMSNYIARLFKEKKISDRKQGYMLFGLSNYIRFILNEYLDNLDDNYNPLDYIIYGKEDEYEYNFIANYLGDYIGYSFIRDFCNPILLDNETSEILESSLYINLCERFTNIE
jgi:hypothetical protein